MRVGVRFRVADVVTDLGEDEIAALLSELHELGWPTGSRPDVLAVHSAVLAHQTDLDRPRGTFQPDEGDQALLLRATDHLRNLGHRGTLGLLRDRLLAAAGVMPIEYRLQSLDGRPAAAFMSYSSEYRPGDRLVLPGGKAGYVVALQPAEPLVLVVGDWRDHATGVRLGGHPPPGSRD